MKSKPTRGSLLRAHRERLGLTQEQVEARAKIGQAHVSAIEVGRRQPSLEILLALCSLYGLDAAQRGELLQPFDDAPAADACV